MKWTIIRTAAVVVAALMPRIKAYVHREPVKNKTENHRDNNSSNRKTSKKE